MRDTRRLEGERTSDPMTDEDEDAALAELNATPGDVEAEVEGRGDWVHEDFDELEGDDGTE